MLGLPDQTPGLQAYIAARLDIDDKTDRRVIADTGVDPAVANGWGWVRAGRMRRAALNGLLHQIVALPQPQRQRLVIGLASYWIQSPPLVDQRGWPYTANSGGLTYLTLCCQATPTYCEWILCCRVCYQDVEQELAGQPEPSSSDSVYVSAVERSLRDLRTRVQRRGWLRPTDAKLWRVARRADPSRYGHHSNDFQLATLREFYDRAK
ncbi:hypothetical protein [Phytohabitans rumicis]|uniref:Uncharacterized protein n=1 Tax=Phytohabitans rumicis TaxID=1076125 RepID=A0A6V8LED6_9ACTN|nr:hypothetical protein [Phytohabitans rumicis]GFJ93318.1 hypothetical protein Prum_069600 [Phytohabitans rumicis]